MRFCDKCGAGTLVLDMGLTEEELVAVNVYGLKPCPNCGEVEKQSIVAVPIGDGAAIHCDVCNTTRGPVRDSEFTEECLKLIDEWERETVQGKMIAVGISLSKALEPILATVLDFMVKICDKIWRR